MFTFDGYELIDQIEMNSIVRSCLSDFSAVDGTAVRMNTTLVKIRCINDERDIDGHVRCSVIETRNETSIENNPPIDDHVKQKIYLSRWVNTRSIDVEMYVVTDSEQFR
jgi:hypothetical protein